MNGNPVQLVTERVQRCRDSIEDARRALTEAENAGGTVVGMVLFDDGTYGMFGGSCVNRMELGGALTRLANEVLSDHDEIAGLES